jgi:hypothetical protein
MKDIHFVCVQNINIFKGGQFIEGVYRYKAFAVYGIDSYRKGDPVTGQKWLWCVMAHEVFLIKGFLFRLGGMPVVTASRFTGRHSAVSVNGWMHDTGGKYPESYERIEGEFLLD